MKGPAQETYITIWSLIKFLLLYNCRINIFRPLTYLNVFAFYEKAQGTGAGRQTRQKYDCKNIYKAMVYIVSYTLKAIKY